MKLATLVMAAGLSSTVMAAPTEANATSAAAMATATAMSNGTNPYPMFQLSSDSEFAFVLEEVLALAMGDGAATGEVLRAASQIVPGDFESWYREFIFLATKLKKIADGIDATRFPVSVRDLSFRIASYLRISTFFLRGNQSDPRMADTWAEQISTFDTAISLLDVPARRYNITASNFTVPIIFFPASNNESHKAPTLLAGSGYDGSQEDLYHGIGVQALARGYNFVTYEGPGQPTVRLQQHLGFIPNWWSVVTPVVDFLESHPAVDPSRLALLGDSFGGTLAPLATTHEKRFAATLAVDGLVSMRDRIESIFQAGGGASIIDLFTSGNETAFNAAVNQLRADPESSTELRWLFDQSLWAFNTESAFEWFTRLGAFSLQPVADHIPGPLFDAYGQDDTLTGNQAYLFQDLFANRSTFHFFPTDLGAGEHCQLGNEPLLGQAAFDWLADVFAGRNLTVGV